MTCPDPKSCPHARLKKSIALALVAMALAIWAFRWLAYDSPVDSRSLLDTQGIQTQMLEMDRDGASCRVRFEVANASRRAAQQVVLTVSLLDDHGHVLMANPLVAVANLPAGDRRQSEVVFAPPGAQAAASAKVQCSLVRWDNR